MMMHVNVLNFEQSKSHNILYITESQILENSVFCWYRNRPREGKGGSFSASRRPLLHETF